MVLVFLDGPGQRRVAGPGPGGGVGVEAEVTARTRGWIPGLDRTARVGVPPERRPRCRDVRGRPGGAGRTGPAGRARRAVPCGMQGTAGGPRSRMSGCADRTSHGPRPRRPRNRPHRGAGWPGYASAPGRTARRPGSCVRSGVCSGTPEHTPTPPRRPLPVTRYRSAALQGATGSREALPRPPPGPGQPRGWPEW